MVFRNAVRIELCISFTAIVVVQGGCTAVVTLPNAAPARSCQVSSDCDSGWTCVQGLCGQDCSLATECPLETQDCVSGVCIAVTSPACSRDADCLSPPVCSSAGGPRCYAGTCHYQPQTDTTTQCNTGSVCQANGHCDGKGVCVGTNPCIHGETPKCTDANTYQAYLGQGACSPSSDPSGYACAYQQAPPITFAGSGCAAKLAICQGVECAAQNGGCLAQGYCNPSTGAPVCDYTPAPSQTACAYAGGASGQCTNAGICVAQCQLASDCDDGNDCTDDTCDATNRCQNTSLTGTCTGANNDCIDTPLTCVAGVAPPTSTTTSVCAGMEKADATPCGIVACTGNGNGTTRRTCQGGLCSGAPTTTACSADTCNPKTCTAGVCATTGTPIPTCAVQDCNSVTRDITYPGCCKYTPEPANTVCKGACDGLHFTAGVCGSGAQAGKCAAGVQKPCDTSGSHPCITGCDPTSGCQIRAGSCGAISCTSSTGPAVQNICQADGTCSATGATPKPCKAAYCGTTNPNWAYPAQTCNTTTGCTDGSYQNCGSKPTTCGTDPAKTYGQICQNGQCIADTTNGTTCPVQCGDSSGNSSDSLYQQHCKTSTGQCDGTAGATYIDSCANEVPGDPACTLATCASGACVFDTTHLNYHDCGLPYCNDSDSVATDTCNSGFCTSDYPYISTTCSTDVGPCTACTSGACQAAIVTNPLCDPYCDFGSVSQGVAWTNPYCDGVNNVCVYYYDDCSYYTDGPCLKSYACNLIDTACEAQTDLCQACSNKTLSMQSLGSAGSYSLYGCPGWVPWSSNYTLCDSGYWVCSADDVATYANAAPLNNYWTGNDLTYKGDLWSSCEVGPMYWGDSDCTGSNHGPMRVCASHDDSYGDGFYYGYQYYYADKDGWDNYGNFCYNEIDCTASTIGLYGDFPWFGGCGPDVGKRGDTAGSICCGP